MVKESKENHQTSMMAFKPFMVHTHTNSLTQLNLSHILIVCYSCSFIFYLSFRTYSIFKNIEKQSIASIQIETVSPVSPVTDHDPRCHGISIALKIRKHCYRSKETVIIFRIGFCLWINLIFEWKEKKQIQWKDTSIIIINFVNPIDFIHGSKNGKTYKKLYIFD